MSNNNTPTYHLAPNFPQNANSIDQNMEFFLLGSARSGTTLMQAILSNANDMLPTIREAVELQHILESYRVCARLSQFEHSFLVDPQTILQNYQRLGKNIFSALRNKYGSKHILAKSPILTAQIDLVHELFPNANIICMIRNPVDVIGSMQKYGANASTQEKQHKWDTIDLDFLTEEFLNYCRPLFKQTNSDLISKIIFVKYETLVAQPDNIIGAIYQFLGLECDSIEAITANPWSNSKLNFDQQNSAAYMTKHYGQKISERSTTKSRVVLPETALQSLRGFAKKFDYEL